jgi:hypothetical protein
MTGVTIGGRGTTCTTSENVGHAHGAPSHLLAVVRLNVRIALVIVALAIDAYAEFVVRSKVQVVHSFHASPIGRPSGKASIVKSPFVIGRTSKRPGDGFPEAVAVRVAAARSEDKRAVPATKAAR